MQEIAQLLILLALVILLALGKCNARRTNESVWINNAILVL